MRFMTESLGMQSALPVKYLLVPGEKLNLVLMCIVALKVAMLKSTEHIRNFVMSNVWKSIDLCNTFYD
jgi:hypothetical protein